MQRYQEILLHLSLIQNVGPGAVKKITALVPRDTISGIYAYLISDFMALGFSQALATRIFNGLKDTHVLFQELALIRQHAVNILTIYDESYPYLLKNITSPPPIIYFWGQPPSDADTCISIIGSRKAGSYAAQAADKLIPSFVANDWVVVSGGAIGADTLAHSKTVQLGGRTIVILGSGLLKPYPRQNRKLFGEVLRAKGTIMSIFPLMMDPLPSNFPARNRVIAGLSQGTVVLQAARKSGALITATFALEQGREVFAVPGKIDDELSQGVHDLIKQGACLTTCIEDVFAAFEFVEPEQPRAILEVNASFIYQEDEAGAQSCHHPDIQMILSACEAEISFDDLLMKSNFDQSKLHELLFELQLQGLVEQTHAGLWRVI